MRGGSFFPLLGIALLIASSGAAEEVGPEQVTIIPQNYYIGDLISVQVEMRHPAAREGANPAVDREDKWIQIQSINTIERSGRMYLFLQVRTFFTGERSLPPIRYGENIITGITLSPQSYIENEQYPFYSIRDSLLLPNTSWIILLSLSVCASVLTAGIIIGKRLKLLYPAVKRKLRHLLGYGDVLKTMRYLGKNYEDMAPREVYKLVGGIVKKRIEQEFNVCCTYMTTDEITALFPGDSTIRALLSRGDFVRFGDRRVGLDQIAEDIKSVEELSRTIHSRRTGSGGESAEC